MSRKFIPSREAELLQWSENFCAGMAKLSGPLGLAAQQVQAYQSQHEAFAALYEKAQDVARRTQVIVQQKNDAKRSLVRLARQLARQIQDSPETTDEMRSALGLTVHVMKRKRIARPSDVPQIDVLRMDGSQVHLRLTRGPCGRSSKPAGVQGASVFSYVGDEPPNEVGRWTFEGNTSRTICAVDVTCSTDRVVKAWLTACWYNPRGESGPAAKPVCVQIARTMVTAA